MSSSDYLVLINNNSSTNLFTIIWAKAEKVGTLSIMQRYMIVRKCDFEWKKCQFQRDFRFIAESCFLLWIFLELEFTNWCMYVNCKWNLPILSLICTPENELGKWIRFSMKLCTTGWPKSKFANSNGYNSVNMHFWTHVGKSKMCLGGLSLI